MTQTIPQMLEDDAGKKTLHVPPSASVHMMFSLLAYFAGQGTLDHVDGVAFDLESGGLK